MRTVVIALSALLVVSSLLGGCICPGSGGSHPMVPDSAKAGELVWTIWSTSVYEQEGKVVGEKVFGGEPKDVTDPKNRFPTRDQCLAEIDKQLDWMEQQGIAKRVSKYEIRSNTTMPYGLQWTTRWECKEVKGGS
jgi:hypothetical protein